MTTEVVTVPPATPATSLARLLADRGISVAPVTDPGGRLLGVVTEGSVRSRANQCLQRNSWGVLPSFGA